MGVSRFVGEGLCGGCFVCGEFAVLGRVAEYPLVEKQPKPNSLSALKQKSFQAEMMCTSALEIFFFQPTSEGKLAVICGEAIIVLQPPSKGESIDGSGAPRHFLLHLFEKISRHQLSESHEVSLGEEGATPTRVLINEERTEQLFYSERRFLPLLVYREIIGK